MLTVFCLEGCISVEVATVPPFVVGSGEKFTKEHPHTSF
jgi:hypothetical protein